MVEPWLLGFLALVLSLWLISTPSSLSTPRLVPGVSLASWPPPEPAQKAPLSPGWGLRRREGRVCVACGWVPGAVNNTQAVTTLISPPQNISYGDSTHSCPTPPQTGRDF